jgi:hypothetical protein
MNESYTDEIERFLNVILDKISDVGYDNLSKTEKEILQIASEDREKVKDYIDDPDKEELSFDKLGHILINGVPYDEYHANPEKYKNNKKDDDEWGITQKGRSSGIKSNNQDLKIMVYKNSGEDQRYYYLFFEKGVHAGRKNKYYTNMSGYPYGKMTNINSWSGKNMDSVHKILEKQYDMYKQLSDKEISDFETMMLMISKFSKKELSDNEKNMLNKYYNYFENI